MKIYAVDDEVLALDMLAGAIHEAYPDAEIKKFHSSVECLEQMKQEPCDVLFSDIQMPDMP